MGTKTPPPSRNAASRRIVICSLAGGACWALWTWSALAGQPDAAQRSAAAKALLEKLDPFFKQHVVADGLLIAGSEKVSKYALHEVAYLARKMLANRPELLSQFGRPVSVMAYTEMQTDLPDCRGLSPWWDYRARGLAGSAISCGEENVLNFPGDPWQGENIFVHEFAHGIHRVLQGADKRFKARLEALHDKAKKSGRFRGYGIEGGAGEFWAEGVQAWFNCNGTIRPKFGGGQSSLEALDAQGKHLCHITKRDQVKTHLPDLAGLLDESFRQNQWVYVPVAQRLHEPHLRGFDPAKAPTFRWPKEVVEAFYRQEKFRELRLNVPGWARVSLKQAMTAKALDVPVAFQNSVGMRFVLIPAGTFQMGSGDSAARVARQCTWPDARADRFAHEHPQHEVTLAKQSAKDKTTKPAKRSPSPKEARHPAVGISWTDAAKFCRQLSERDGREYALPTEAQWEYACRAGTTTPFAFGETISTDQANYNGSYSYGTGRKGAYHGKPLPVGSLPANAWGLYDMHGNVQEWCADRYRGYHASARSRPAVPAEGNERVLRGGAWRSDPAACRSAHRHRREAGACSNAIGFRVVCKIPTKEAK